jgi:hypothetical protein
MTVPLRAAHLRVSTARQAEHDVSIPDQRKQGAKPIACRGDWSWSIPSSRPAHRRRTTGGPSSSA